MSNTSVERPLFRQYPGLKQTLAHRALGALPTPVERLKNLEETIQSPAAGLYIKRDDLSGRPYGGNKVRKLEFILARALQKGYKEVLTFGGAGSNHALATAIYAKQLGLGSISMLIPQPNAHSVRANLLMSLRAGAELHQSPGMIPVALSSLKQLCLHKIQRGSFPYLIAPGGTSPLGMVGFVNAAFELRAQVEEGLIPEPDCIYAASGTMGTVAGLLLGLKAAGMRTRVAAVRVTEAKFSSVKKAKRFFHAANQLLHRADPAFPMLPFPDPDFIFTHDYFGEAYGLYTPESMDAVRLLHETSGIHLEGTYTGKTFAALLAHIKSGRLDGKTVLFWNTHNSTGFENEIAGMDYHQLPGSFHCYFEEEVQPLDHHS